MPKLSVDIYAHIQGTNQIQRTIIARELQRA